MRFTERIIAPHIHRFLFRNVSVRWHWPEGEERPEDWEALRFPGGSGGELAGLWGGPEGAAKGVVVLAHPTCRKAKGYFLALGHARSLREAGYHVLLFDFNGFGESPHAGFYYPRDVLAAGREAHRRHPHLPVGLLGVCFGAVYGVCALRDPDHPYTAAVLEAPYGSVAEILESMARHSRRPAFFRARAKVMRGLVPLRPSMDALRQARRARGLRHALFVTGTEDTVVPAETVHRFVSAFREAPGLAGARVDLWAAPGGKHLETPLADPEGYARRIAAFFDGAFAHGALAPAASAPRAAVGPLATA